MKSPTKHRAHSEPKTNVEWFKYYLYRDPDFLTQSSLFNSWLKTVLSEKSRIVLELTSSEIYPLKLHLEEYLGRCEGMEIIEATARKFEIPEHVVEYGFIKVPKLRGVTDERRPHIFKARSNSVTVNENEVVIVISPNTRLEDIEESWFYVESLQKETAGYTPQLQTTAKYDLIYAIYKQRLKDETGKRTSFSKIFQQYQADKLIGYSGSTTQLNSAASLAAKYRQFIAKSNEM